MFALIPCVPNSRRSHYAKDTPRRHLPAAERITRRRALTLRTRCPQARHAGISHTIGREAGLLSHLVIVTSLVMRLSRLVSPPTVGTVSAAAR